MEITETEAGLSVVLTTAVEMYHFKDAVHRHTEYISEVDEYLNDNSRSLKPKGSIFCKYLFRPDFSIEYAMKQTFVVVNITTYNSVQGQHGIFCKETQQLIKNWILRQMILKMGIIIPL
jgi:hypothetical protein